jgi:flagellin
MTINNIARSQMDSAMLRLTTGQRINSAADDAAGLSIANKMDTQIRGYEQGTANTRDMQNLVNVAEGGLATIGSALGRIRELSVQAANGTNTPDDRGRIQNEISQLADHIQSTVENTQFNTINLLDGTFKNQNTASNPDGTGARVSINDMSGLAQAISNFNVTGEFNITDIDNALAQVNNERSNLGAMSNRFDYTVENNENAVRNLTQARSRIMDADIAREMMNFTQGQVLSQMQILMQQHEQNRMRNEHLAPLFSNFTNPA